MTIMQWDVNGKQGAAHMFIGLATSQDKERSVAIVV
jgi:hypothetical protein